MTKDSDSSHYTPCIQCHSEEPEATKNLTAFVKYDETVVTASEFKLWDIQDDGRRKVKLEVWIPAIDVYLLPLTNNLDLLIIPKL